LLGVCENGRGTYSAGVENKLITLPGLGHSFDRQMGDARVREALESMLAFLRDTV